MTVNNISDSDPIKHDIDIHKHKIKRVTKPQIPRVDI